MGSVLSAEEIQNSQNDDLDSYVILEPCPFQETLEECDISFQKLKTVATETQKGLKEIEPILHHNQREFQIVSFTGNAFASFGFLLRTVGIVKAIPTLGASLWLALVGSAFSVGGHLTSTSASMIGEIVQDKTYNRALNLLKDFVASKREYLENVREVCEDIKSTGKGHGLRDYEEVVEMLTEYLTLLEKHPSTFGVGEDGEEIPPHASKGVSAFVQSMKSFAKGGAEVTLASVAKIMNPLRVVVDVGFLAYSLVELCKNEECRYEQLVDLMTEAIEKDMLLMEALHNKVNSFVVLDSKHEVTCVEN